MTGAIQPPHLNLKITLNRVIFTMGLESAGAGSALPTAVYKNGYIKEVKCNHDRCYTSPPTNSFH